MIRNEIKYIYDTIDMDKNDKLSQDEFKDFQELFIAPFEGCKPDAQYCLGID